MAETTPANVVMLDRSVYNNMVEAGTIDASTIYFVREGTSETANMMSLYVGTAKQCDVVDISNDTDITFDPISDTYSIPQKYQVSDKLFFFEQNIVTDMEDSTTPVNTPMYHLCAWNPNLRKFLNCTGIPNNVVVCTNGTLPRTSGDYKEAIKDFIYVDVMNRNMYVFDGNSYIPLIVLGDYATHDWVENYVAEHSTSVDVDNVTILKTDQNVLHGAGADLSGRTITGLSGMPSMVAQEGAHAFNKYGIYVNDAYTVDYREYNVAVYSYSSVFGLNNKETPTADPNYATNTNYGHNLIAGYYNTVNGLSESFVMGDGNTTRITKGFTTAAILGRDNFCGADDAGTSLKHSNIFECGYGNKVIQAGQNKTAYRIDTALIGYENRVDTETDAAIAMLGRYNHAYLESGGSGYFPNVNHGEQISYDNYDFIAGAFNVLGNTGSQGAKSRTFGIILGTNNQAFNIQYQDGHASFVAGHDNQIDAKTMDISVIGDTNEIQSVDSVPDYTGGIVSNTHVVGHHNEVNATTTFATIDGVFISGSDNSVQCEADEVFVYGSNNSVTGTTVAVENFMAIGFGLSTNQKTDQIVIGYYNDDSPTMPSGVDPKITLAAGSANLSRSVSAVVGSDGNIYAFGNIISSSTDAKFVSANNNLSLTPSSGSVTLTNLPSNGDQNIISTANTVSSVTVSNLNVPVNGSNVAISTVGDYCATIIFKKDVALTDINDAMTNFDPASQSPRIYLMNPGLDISEYTVIHLMIFYDGMNTCCIAGGYKEDPVQ